MTSTQQPALNNNINNPLSKRRRFQPPITSYFSSTTDSSSSSSSADGSNDDNNIRLSHNNYSSPTFSATPALPHKVQASLLTVGMRIRKSVPEGYKTEALKPSVYALAAASASSTTTTSTTSSSSDVSTGRLGYCAARTSYAELAPYCGIHKIGNLAMQSFPEPAGQTPSDQVSTDEGDAFSLPSSSQESVTTTSSISLPPPNPHKRTYDDELSDDEEDVSFNNRVSINSNIPGRTILSPRLGQQRRVFSPLRNNDNRTREDQQENRDPFSMDVDGDFEEAAFLRRREEVDSDYLAMDVSGT
ncbi:hypothetical protein VTN00DRAFT_9170 [Thermoascus crustaceus]|uniref:uncharacterized protein n=1 Tax=Thermoascus crustaceus TaxID=5088 RepID=UPI0037429E85